MADKFIDPVGQHFELPVQYLNQLSEMCPEGFVLFFIDDQGEPQVRAQFQHRITEMGLRAYATKFLQEINTIEEKGIAENLIQQDKENDQENEDWSEES